MKTKKDVLKDVLKVILEVVQLIKHNGLMLNERYLHHLFSHLFQEKYLLNLSGDSKLITLHPEWPTYKKQTGLIFGRYKKLNDLYKPNKDGKAGFIDFAIGDYKKPDIGIEFTLKYGWSKEEVIYDFLKLLDKKNPFNTSISFNVIFREKSLVKGGYLRNLEQHMNDAFTEAVNRLKGEVCDNSRGIYFIITEIDKDNNKRHWHYDRTIGKFENDLFVIA